MLPKSERLTTIDFVGLRPKFILRGTYSDIAVTPSTASRFACVIAKKRIKRAVDRNTVKRKIYSILRTTRPQSLYLVIVYPKLSALSGSYSHIQREIAEAFATL